MEQKPHDTLSLAHTSWKCQYHIVFALKNRRKAVYGKLRAEIRYPYFLSVTRPIAYTGHCYGKKR